MSTCIRHDKVKFANYRNNNKWVVVNDDRLKLMSNINVNLLDKSVLIDYNILCYN